MREPASTKTEATTSAAPPPAPKRRLGAKHMIPGLLVAITIALASMFVSEHYGGPTLLYALLIGMALNFLASETSTAPGIRFSGKFVLRLGVALLGARIGLDKFAALGVGPLAMVAAAVGATILVGILAARLIGRDARFGLLTGGATAICGASAALALSAILPDREGHQRDTLFTVVAVTTLSTVAMILYPALVGVIGLDDRGAGILLGGTIHDVAQVVGAGYLISETAGDAATVTKLFRVALLVPVTLIVSAFVVRMVVARAETADGTGGRPAVGLPNFLIAFMVLAALQSLGLLPEPVVGALSELSRWCLVIAIAAIGVRTSMAELKDLGWAPLGLVVGETLFLLGFVLGGLWLLGFEM